MGGQRRALISREIKRASNTVQGRVVSALQQVLFDPSGASALTWVCDVHAGQNRILKNVLVKLSGGNRSYAQVGLAVQLTRTQRGRWVVTGPADRVIASAAVAEFDEDAGSTTTGLARTGFSVVRQTYDYYKGDLPGTPGSGLYGTPGYPKFLQVDGDGNPV